MAKRAAKKRAETETPPGRKRPAAKSAAKRKPQASVKAAPSSPKKPAAKAQRKPSKSVESDRVATLEAELKAAKARIAELEAAQADVLNRIDWVLDTLKTSLEITERRRAK